MGQPPEEPGWRLAFAFDSHDPQFTRGFEAGMIYQRAYLGLPVEDQPIHSSNSEMVMRIAESVGMRFTGKAINDEWIMVSLYYAVPGQE